LIFVLFFQSHEEEELRLVLGFYFFLIFLFVSKHFLKVTGYQKVTTDHNVSRVVYGLFAFTMTVLIAMMKFELSFPLRQQETNKKIQ